MVEHFLAHYAMFLALLLQEDPATLIEQLASEKIEERDAAEQELKKLGEPARAELQKAAKSGDAEVAARAAHLLRILDVRKELTENLLKAMPGVEQRVLRGEWAEVFLEAIGKNEHGERRYRRLKKEDVENIGERALETPEECKILAVLHGIQQADFKTVGWTAVARLLGHRSKEVRFHAASLLADLGAKEAAPEIVKLLKDADANVRYGAALALAELRAEEPVPDIVRLFKDKDSRLHIAAAAWLAALGAKEAVPDVVKLLKDTDSCIRSSAAWSLAKLAGKEATPHIVNLLQDPDWEVRRSALRVLANLGAKESVPEIVRLLKDENANVRHSAVEALGSLGATEAAPEIVKLQQDSDLSVRRAALEALGKLGAREVVPEIINLLKDADADVRHSATWLLGELRTKEAAPEIVLLLKDAEEAVRETAAGALAEMGAKEAVPELLPLLEDPSQWVCMEAASSLALLGSTAGVDVLLDDTCSNLEPLNALRRPDEWSRIRGKRLSLDVEGSAAVVWKQLEEESGLSIDATSAKCGESSSRVASGKSIYQALQTTYDTNAFAIILEKDRIRILPREDARNFWKDWWAKERR